MLNDINNPTLKLEINLSQQDWVMLTGIIKSTAEIYLEMFNENKTEKLDTSIRSVARILRALEEAFLKEDIKE